MSNTHGSSDLQHIRKALALFVRERDTVELRIPNSGKGTVSGYFDTLDAAAKAAAQWSGKVPAVYLTINPVNPTLLARSKNRLETVAGLTTNPARVATSPHRFPYLKPHRFHRCHRDSLVTGAKTAHSDVVCDEAIDQTVGYVILFS